MEPQRTVKIWKLTWGNLHAHTLIAFAREEPFGCKHAQKAFLFLKGLKANEGVEQPMPRVEERLGSFLDA
jgi:hypothetical protein